MEINNRTSDMASVARLLSSMAQMEPHSAAMEAVEDAPQQRGIDSSEEPSEELAVDRQLIKELSRMVAAKAAKPARKLSFGDRSAQLTRRLVAAKSQFEVRQIIAEASAQMSKARAAIFTDGNYDEAALRASIKRMEKLMMRGQRKIKDLDGEDGMRARRRKAEQRQQRKRAEEIKEELRKEILARMTRERGYLLDRQGFVPAAGIPGKSMQKLDAATEADIAAQAYAMAATEVAMPSLGEGGVGVDIVIDAAQGLSAQVEGAEGADSQGGPADIEA